MEPMLLTYQVWKPRLRDLNASDIEAVFPAIVKHVQDSYVPDSTVNVGNGYKEVFDATCLRINFSIV
jgi:hypothetical protein